MKNRLVYVAGLLAVATGCPTDDPDADTGGAQTGSSEDDGPDPTMSNPTTGDPSDSDETSGGQTPGTDTAGETGNTTSVSTGTDATDEGTDDETETETGSSTGSVIEPADLPYGGWVSDYWFVDGIHVPLATMQTVEYPDGTEPSFIRAPLPDAPPSQAQWVFSNEPVAWDPKGPVPIETGYSVGPQIFYEDGTVSFLLEEQAPDSVGTYLADFAFAPYLADSWTVDFLGGDDAPAETFTDVLAAESPEFEFVMEDGIVTSISWTPYSGDDYAQVEVWTSLDGDGFDDIDTCNAVAPDSGTLEIPIECFYPDGGVDAGYTELYFTIQRLHATDIAYNDRRIRVDFVAARQDYFAYPPEQ